MDREVSEAEVIESLSVFGGRGEHAFLRRGLVNLWNPRAGMLVACLDDDNDRSAACIAFLRARGWVYETDAEVDAHAERYGWANWPITPERR
jgi:hypothetical protein